MKTTSSDDLFELIQSLNASEKGYLKKFFGGIEESTEKNFVILFDILCKQKSYDEEKLSKSLSKKNISTKISVLKNYLYKQVLRGLRAYHTDLSTNYTLRNSLDEAEILLRRGLIHQAQKSIEKAIHKAEESNAWPHLFLLKLFEIDILSMERDSEGMSNSSQAIVELLRKILNLREIELYYLNLTYLYLYHYPLRTDVETQKLKQILEQPVLSSESLQLSSYALANYYGCRFLEGILTHQPENAYEYQLKKYRLVSNPELFKMQNYVYQIINLSSLALSCVLCGKFDEADKILLEIFESKAGFPSGEMIRERQWLSVTIMRNIHTNVISYSLDELNHFLKKIQANSEPDSTQNLNLCLLAILFFNIKEYNRCLEICDGLLQNQYPEKERNSQILIRILIPLAHLESGNTNIIPFLAENHQRHLKNRKYLFPPENAIFNFLQSLPYKSPGSEYIKKCKDHLLQMNEMLMILNHKNAFIHFKYTDWLSQHIISYQSS